ncbi:MAG TPA: nitric-oxide reductase large subunit [Candidatus Acidoferrales bacterium]|nr:nitric-oxide reductase large subunit [Candidatus Acidoferrales bacterium]
MNSSIEQKSGLWKHGLLLTLLFGFTVMIVGGVLMYRSRAPIPSRVTAPDGSTLFTAADIQQGQDLFRKRGLMDYGTVLGHGAYLGPDYTAEALHWMTEAMRSEKAADYGSLGVGQKAAVDAEIAQELKMNRYAGGTLAFTAGQVAGWNVIVNRYYELVLKGQLERALPKGALLPVAEGGGDPARDREAARQLAAFVTWTAWLSVAKRPEAAHSYTNNWPYDKAAGNTATAGSMMWSAVSVATLLFFLALILYFQHRYQLSAVDVPNPKYRYDLAEAPLTPSQRAAAKYFVIALVLFLVQCLLGGKMAHDYVDGASFFGFNLSQYLPFNIARTWHLQLAIFWIATAWLGMGIFIAPLVSGREPRGQRTLVNILFGALVIVVVGSLAGEYLSIKGLLGKAWWWLGTQGWEYLELGRLWMLLLIAGMAIWLYIVARGLRAALKAESDRGGLTHLLLYSSTAIPVFYCFALFVNRDSHITMADYWRWWLIHLWVEGMFEVFAVVVIGFLMVRLGLVTAHSTLRATYFQLIILLGSGIIGTGHHYYWIGAPEAWMALGAVFSALEVIPLSLLMVEAYGQYKVIKAGGHEFPYKAAFWFLLATGFWNLFGAGVLGFLINLPFVSYFQHGSFLTAAHGHGALMGVYGMLAVALALFSLRNIVDPRYWKERWFMAGFWGLNAGLMGMIVITLVPIGVLQAVASFNNGFWSARSLEFYRQPVVQTLLWLRMAPDTVFIAIGALPIVAGAVYGFLHLRPLREPHAVKEAIEEAEEELVGV